MMARNFVMKSSSILAEILWAGLCGLRLRQVWEQQTIIPVLLAFQAGLVAYWLIKRRKPTAESPRWTKFLAWSSAFLPLILRIDSQHAIGTGITLFGLILTLVSQFQLGSSFGIAPADRGLVRSGLYRIIRHPMYAGELLSVLGALINNWNIWNIGTLCLLLVSLIWRIRLEESCVFGYSAYQQRTNWRLIPGVW